MTQPSDLPQASRRSLLKMLALAGIVGLAPRLTTARTKGGLAIIEAPSNLGLRPLSPGHEPGTWRAPEALRQAGLHEALGRPRVVRLPRPRYVFGAVPGSTVRNGPAIGDFARQLARPVTAALDAGEFPLVLGGDCSILLGCLLGARSGGRCGLIHVDGHSDFYHPDPAKVPPPYSAAGMDLALATGRGERLLAHWPEAGGPLVADADVLQLGEREELDSDYAYPDIAQTAIERITVRRALELGLPATLERIARWCSARGLSRVWLHIDTDVLDQAVFAAVDSPGSPGLDFAQLGTLIHGVRRTCPVIGADVCVFDPEKDPDGRLARRLSSTLAEGFSGAGAPREGRG